MSDDRARLAALAVDMETIAAVLRGDVSISVPGLPSDARYVRSYADWPADGIVMVYAHPSFDPVDLGEAPKRLRTSFVIKRMQR